MLNEKAYVAWVVVVVIMVLLQINNSGRKRCSRKEPEWGKITDRIVLIKRKKNVGLKTAPILLPLVVQTLSKTCNLPTNGK